MYAEATVVVIGKFAVSVTFRGVPPEASVIVYNVGVGYVLISIVDPVFSEMFGAAVLVKLI